MLHRSIPSLVRRCAPFARRTFSQAAAAALPPSVVVLEYKYGPNMLERREPYHAGHYYLVQEMISNGQCLAGGPVVPHRNWSYDGAGGAYTEQGYDGTGGNEPTGAFFWFNSIDEANEFMRKDPYANADLVTDYAIYDWNVTVKK